MALERKALPTVTSKDGTTSSPMTGVIGHDDADGTVTAIVAVSGVRDRVGDLITPGALGRSLKRIKPKGVNNHQWGEKVSRPAWIEELLPGDGRLPELTADGSPWPREAGALMVKAKYNLDKQVGRDAYSDAKFYGRDENFSIGYMVLPGGSRKTRNGRDIRELNVCEYSQVLHGAHGLASLVGVKSLLDAVQTPEEWYAEDRSGIDLEGADLPAEYGVEIKANIRTVKDPKYWNLPYGTPIRAGQKPRGDKARAARAEGKVPSARRGTTAPDDDQDALLPETGARRVKPRERDEWAEGSVDPAEDLAALIHDARNDTINQAKVDLLLAEVLDDALTPAEFEEELRDILDEELRDVSDEDVRPDVLAEVLDDYRELYRERLAEQERTGRAGVNPDVRVRAIDLASEAIDDQNREKLVKALRALEDANPRATADWVLSTLLSTQTGHVRFEAALAALDKGGQPPRRDTDLTGDARKELLNALVNSRDDEPEGSHEHDALNAALAELEGERPATTTDTPSAPDRPVSDQPLAIRSRRDPREMSKAEIDDELSAIGRAARSKRGNAAKQPLVERTRALNAELQRREEERQAELAAVGERAKDASLTTADYERIKKNSHPAARDAALRKLTDAELAALKYESHRRGKRAENMQDSVRSEEIRRRLAPAQLRERADRSVESDRKMMRDLGRDESEVKPDRQARQFYERADDYERRDAAGIGRHDYDVLPLGEQPSTTEKPAAKTGLDSKAPEPERPAESATIAPDQVARAAIVAAGLQVGQETNLDGSKPIEKYIPAPRARRGSMGEQVRSGPTERIVATLGADGKVYTTYQGEHRREVPADALPEFLRRAEAAAIWTAEQRAKVLREILGEPEPEPETFQGIELPLTRPQVMRSLLARRPPGAEVVRDSVRVTDPDAFAEWLKSYPAPRRGSSTRAKSEYKAAQELHWQLSEARRAESSERPTEPEPNKAADSTPARGPESEGVTAARRLLAMVTYRRAGTAVGAKLARLFGPETELRASSTGSLAAAKHADGWTIVATLPGFLMPPLSGDLTPEQVNGVIAELMDLGIPWSGSSALEERWSNPDRKQDDQEAIQAVIARHSRPKDKAAPEKLTAAPQPGANEVRQARRDAEDAIDGQDRDALADALTRMGVGASADDRDPRDVAGGLLVLDRETQAQRLDRYVQAATMVAEPEPETPAEAAPVSKSPVTTTWSDRIDVGKAPIPKTLAELFTQVDAVGGEARIERGTDDRLWKISVPREIVGGGVRQFNIGSVGYFVRDGKNRIGPGIHQVRKRLADPRWVKPGQRAPEPEKPVEATKPKPQDTVETSGDTVTVTRKGKRFTLAFSKLPGRTFGPYDFAEAVRDLRVSALLSPHEARDLVMDASTNGTAEKRTGDSPDMETPAEKPVGGMSLDELRAERSGLLRPDRTPAETARLREIRDAMTRLEEEQHEGEVGQRREQNAERDAIAAITQRLTAAGMRQGERNDFQVTRGYVVPQSDRARDFLKDHADEIEQATVDAGHPLFVERRSGMIGKQPPKPETSAEIITPIEQADAEALRGDALGLVEAEDGELEVTEEVAQRQDRIEALIEHGPADLGNRSDDELGGTRRDLVAELALQDEIRRRDAQRRQESRVARTEREQQADAGEAQPAPEAPGPAVEEGPKARPGLAGALEDLADALNEHGVKASDNEQVQAAAKRLATVLRRNKGDSEALTELRTLLGDDALAQIEAGKLRPGRLLTLAGALRQEARDRRNAAARARRLARRIEREKLRSLIGTVDGLLRGRGRDPEQYGGPVPDIQAQAAERESAAPESREPEPATPPEPEAPAEPGDMTDEQLRATDARMDEERRASGARSVTDEHRAIKAELGRRSSKAARSATAKRAAETRARRKAEGLPPKRQPFSLDRPPSGGWTDADLVGPAKQERADELYRQASVALAEEGDYDKVFELVEQGRPLESGSGYLRWDGLVADAQAGQRRQRAERSRSEETVTDRNGPVSVQVSGPAPGDTGQREPEHPAAIERPRAEGEQRSTTEPAEPEGMTPARRREFMDAIEDHAVEYGGPKAPSPGPESAARYLVEGHVTDATPQEWDWLARYLKAHPELLEGEPPTQAQLTERRQRRLAERQSRADALSKQARESFDAGDPDRALELVEQAREMDPGRGRLWSKIANHVRGQREAAMPPRDDRSALIVHGAEDRPQPEERQAPETSVEQRAEGAARMIDESGRPSLQDLHLDARADAKDAIASRHRIKLRKALKAMGVDGDPEERRALEQRLLDADGDEDVDTILKEVDAQRDSEVDWRFSDEERDAVRDELAASLRTPEEETPAESETPATRAVKRPGRDDATEYVITLPDGAEKKISVARDYGHVRTVDLGEKASGGRYLTTLHRDEESAGAPHPLHRKAPVTVSRIQDERTSEEQGAQSAPTEGDGDGQRTTAPDPGALPPAPAGEVRGDDTGGLPGTGERSTERDRTDRGRADRDDRPEPARRAADRPVPSGEAERGGDRAPRSADRPERTGDQAGQRGPDTDRPDRGTADGGGRDAERGDGGVRDSGGGVEPDTADPADAGEPADGVTGADQPEANPGQLDAIPDTGPSFRPRGIDDLAPAGEKAKLDANMAALRVLRSLQRDNRAATPDEQTILARWAGWGGLPDVFDQTKSKYETERDELKELLTPAEYNEARRNTLNAHYTDARAVTAMWDAVEALGFDGGRVLEPGSGSGNFIGFAPESARMTGVELDSTTAAISHALYPHAKIRNESFAKTRLPDGSFDMTIGNVPFLNRALTDKRHNKAGENLHNHFIIKSLALTRPGGLVAVLTSRYTMDARGSRARRTMADMADLVGAVRLPTGSHQRASGTSVIEDILIFRRREPGAEPRGDQSWINSSKKDLDGWEIPVNDYWSAHPDHILGEMSGVKGQYGGDIKVTGDKSMADLPTVLSKITHVALATGLGASGRDPDAPEAEFAAPNAMHEGGIVVGADGEFTQNVGGVMVPFDVPASQAEELRGLIGLRDTFTELLDAEAATDRDTSEIQELRQRLNDQYDAHTGRYKPINYYELTRAGARKPNPQGGFRRDPRSAIVRSLERYDSDSGTATKAAIFRKRVAAPRQLQESADNPADALALSMDALGRVDLPMIARLLNTDEDDARDQLGDLVHEQPPLSDAEADAAFRRERDEAEGFSQVEGRFGGSRDFGSAEASDADLSAIGESVRQPGALVPTAEYLSGNVRRKLAAAKAAAEHDPRFKTNVDALEQVIPTDLTPQEIEGRLGAAWIGAGDVKAFADDLLEVPGHLRTDRARSTTVSTSGGGIWVVDAPDGGVTGRETWGTGDRSAGELIQAMLEQRPIKITRTVEGPDGKKKQVADLEATLAAQAKAEAIAERFSEWLWEDPDRSRRLQARYNMAFNAIKLRSYDGDHRELPGKAKAIELWDHQHAAVSRIVNEPAVLLAHVVGSGKTMEMAAGAMELKRLGMAKKPVIVIPNHMKEQFDTEFRQLYPRANILAAGSEDLEGPKRREFVGRVAAEDYDCVILTQKAFEAIPMSPKQQQAYIDREMADMRRQLEEAQAAAEASGDDAAATTVKRMERAVLSAEQALEKKLETGLKDVGGVTWEQTGIDYIFVDEAHQYSNLRTISNIQGAGATGSGMATDLHMKVEYLRETNASNRVVTFATGTPIRNTVTQAYIMMRYLRPDLLREAGINSFDQWAATFGKIIEEMELKPEGSGFRQSARFAKFQNVPELLQIFHVFTDVKMAEDLDLPTPELAGGKVENVVVPRTAQLAEFIRDLGQRAEEVRGGSPRKFDRVDEKTGARREIEDNMLLVSMDGRKGALDMRLVGGTPEAGKIDAAADRISSIWNDNKDRRYPLDPKNPDMGDDPTPGALQIVFLDMGTPGDGKKKSGDWNAYDDLKAKLVARGMDPKSIRYMHEARNDREKAELFAAARSGKIAVLVGSTEKMGVGTNVQARAVALHHLDAPWRPSDVEQRDGRIMRQGNAHQQMGIPVQIIRYVTEGSFDAYMWQTLTRKSKFINQILRGSLNVREIEDVGENSLSYAEVMALATGNPDLMDKARVDTLLGKLTRLQRTHERTQANLRRDAQLYAAKISQSETDADALDGAIARRVDTSGDRFVATVMGQRHGKRTEANAALNEALRDVLLGWSRDPVKVGALGGFDLMAARVRAESGRGEELVLTLDGVPGTIVTYGPGDLRGGQPGTVTRTENHLTGGVPAMRDRLRATAERLRDELPRIQDRIGITFGRTEELKAAQAKSERLRAKMLLDIRRLELSPGAEPIPFDPAIDSARYDSPLVGGGTAADAPPDPDGEIERAEWERMWELRRAQADAERAERSAQPPPPPGDVSGAQQRARTRLAERYTYVSSRSVVQAIADAGPGEIHASPDGRIVAVLFDNGRVKHWKIVAPDTGHILTEISPDQDVDNMDTLLRELAEARGIPWGDEDAMRKRWSGARNAGLKKTDTDVLREIVEQHLITVEEKSLQVEATITPLDVLRARRLRADLEQATAGMRGFA